MQVVYNHGSNSYTIWKTNLAISPTYVAVMKQMYYVREVITNLNVYISNRRQMNELWEYTSMWYSVLNVYAKYL